MARDLMHDLVKDILISEGWKITHDPYRLRYEEKKIEIDLGAERLLAAEKASERILIEVKSFLTSSAFYEFHAAIGQYINYRRIMRLNQEARTLYLALPFDVFEQLLMDEFGQLTITEEDLKLIVFDPYHKRIHQWIK